MKDQLVQKTSPKHSIRYEKINEEDENSSSDTSNEMDRVHSPLLNVFRPQKKRRNWLCTGVSVGILLLLAILVAQIALLSRGLGMYGHHSHGLEEHGGAVDHAHMHHENGHNMHVGKGQVAKYGPKSPCGTHFTEARARGCRYSWALGSWLPDECYDKELEERFEKEYPFEFYYRNASGIDAADLTRPIMTPAELSVVPHDVITYTTWAYHIQHCFHVWHYVHRAGMYNRRISSIFAPEGHTHHCMSMILGNEIPWEAMETKAVNTFPDCVKLEDFAGMAEGY